MNHFCELQQQLSNNIETINRTTMLNPMHVLVAFAMLVPNLVGAAPATKDVTSLFGRACKDPFECSKKYQSCLDVSKIAL